MSDEWQRGKSRNEQWAKNGTRRVQRLSLRVEKGAKQMGPRGCKKTAAYFTLEMDSQEITDEAIPTLHTTGEVLSCNSAEDLNAIADALSLCKIL